MNYLYQLSNEDISANYSIRYAYLLEMRDYCTRQCLLFLHSKDVRLAVFFKNAAEGFDNKLKKFSVNKIFKK